MELTRFSLSTVFTAPIKILFLYYSVMFIKATYQKKTGNDTSRNKLKQIAILVIFIINLSLSVVTHPVLNIINRNIVMPYWVWVNGLCIILLHTSWYYKYDKTLLDAYKPEGVVSQTNMT